MEPKRKGKIHVRMLMPVLTRREHEPVKVTIGQPVIKSRVAEPDPLEILARKYEGLFTGEPTPSGGGSAEIAPMASADEDDESTMQQAVGIHDEMVAKERERNRKLKRFDQLVGSSRLERINSRQGGI